MIVWVQVETSGHISELLDNECERYQVNWAICHCSGTFLFFHVWCIILGIGCVTSLRFSRASTVDKPTESLSPSSKIRAIRDDAIYNAYATGMKKTKNTTAARLFIVNFFKLLALERCWKMLSGNFSRLNHTRFAPIETLISRNHFPLRHLKGNRHLQ